MLWWLLAGVCLLAALVLLTAYICFRLAFYVPRRKNRDQAWQEEVGLPQGTVYEPYGEQIRRLIGELRQMPYEELSVRSHDGLTLYARYYEYAPGAPIEIMFHGYRSRAEIDLGGGVKRGFALGHSVVLVDQRAAGRSEGRVITFGAKERQDCHRWIACLQQRFGEKVPLYLTGLSMGAATVLLAAGDPLPPQVVGVLADCGYTDGGEMIRKTIRELRLPMRLLYPFVRLGARLFGRFSVAEASPIRAMATCRVPVLFVHGEADTFVPCDMSRCNFEACTAEKRLFTVPGAGHGLSYLLQPTAYLQTMREFFPD